MSGPAFVKIGQFLSARPDIVGNKLASELSMLRDSMKGFSNETALSIINKELGHRLFFTKASFRPVAAASVAQVHYAAGQKEMAIKIARPNVDKHIQANLCLLSSIINILNLLSKEFAKLELSAVIQSIGECAKRELDFRLEASNIAEFRERKYQGIYIPEVYWEFTSQRVLTMEWIDGIPINQAPIESIAKAGKNVLLFFLTQSCKEGLFHADMHPGNMLLMPNDDVGLLDYGKVGRLNILERCYIFEVFQGLITKDYKRVAQVHFDLGYIKNKQDIGWLSSACRAVGESTVGRPMIATSNLLMHMLEIAKDFGMQAQPSLMLFHKNLLMIEGAFGNMISFNMWDIAQEWLQKEDTTRHALYFRYALGKHKIDAIGDFLVAVGNLSKPHNHHGVLRLFIINGLITSLITGCIIFLAKLVL